jgi:hypothetical protein
MTQKKARPAGRQESSVTAPTAAGARSGNLAEIPVEQWRALLCVQLEQSWNDIRHNDAILWQIPATIGAIVGLVLNALGKTIVTGPVTWLDAVGVATATIVTFSLIVTEYKNRVFQVTRNIYRKSIYKSLVDIAALKDGSGVLPYVDVREYEGGELPGFVEVATKDISDEVLDVAWKASGFRVLGRQASRLPAYKTLFYISNAVFLGEVGLLISLAIRL